MVPSSRNSQMWSDVFAYRAPTRRHDLRVSPAGHPKTVDRRVARGSGPPSGARVVLSVTPKWGLGVSRAAGSGVCKDAVSEGPRPVRKVLKLGFLADIGATSKSKPRALNPKPNSERRTSGHHQLAAISWSHLGRTAASYTLGNLPRLRKTSPSDHHNTHNRFRVPTNRKSN